MERQSEDHVISNFLLAEPARTTNNQ